MALAGLGELFRLAARRDRLMLLPWLYVLAALLAATGYSFRKLYPDPAGRARLASGIAHNPALLALSGPLSGDSLGALSVWKVGAASAAGAALMSIFVVVRHTRGDEEAGRLELIGSAASGRLAPLAAALAMAGAADLAIGLVVAVAMIAVGMPPAGSLALGLALAGCGLVFAGAAAVTAQVAAAARTARALAIGVLAACYVMMSAGAAAGVSGPAWVGWLSPVGWAVQVRAYAGDRWWVLAPPLAAAVGLSAIGVVLAWRRDLGTGLVAPRPGRAAAGPLLGGPALRPGAARGRARPLVAPLALAWRLQRGALLGWAAGALLICAASASAARGIGSMVGGGQTRQAILRLGGVSGLTSAYLAAIMVMAGLAAGGYATSAVLRLRAEETSQRADPLLATAVSRDGWALSHLAVAVAGCALMLAAAGAGAGIGYGLRAGDPGRQVLRMAGAALAQLPAALAVAGVAVALFGLIPRASVAGGWAALAVAVVIGFFGPEFRMPQWLLDLSPFTHVPRLPGGPVPAAPLAWLSASALALAAAGLAGLRRRDIG